MKLHLREMEAGFVPNLTDSRDHAVSYKSAQLFAEKSQPILRTFPLISHLHLILYHDTRKPEGETQCHVYHLQLQKNFMALL
jgi:hypothetical protein